MEQKISRQKSLDSLVGIIRSLSDEQQRSLEVILRKEGILPPLPRRKMSVYRGEIEDNSAERQVYQIADLAAVGVCAADSPMNVNVLPRMQGVFELIYELAYDVVQKLDDDRHDRSMSGNDG